MDPKALVQKMVGWSRRHPDALLDAARDAVALRLSVPLDALRWGVAQIRGKKVPKDVEIRAVPPGVSFAATLDVMKTQIRASATLLVEEIRLGPEEMRVEIRLKDVSLKILGSSDSPIAALIQSGALDLSKPGKLVSHLPKKPPLIVEAAGDRLVLDFMRDPRIAQRVRRAVSLVTPLVTVTSVVTTGDRLALQLSYLPQGVGAAITRVRAAL